MECKTVQCRVWTQELPTFVLVSLRTCPFPARSLLASTNLESANQIETFPSSSPANIDVIISMYIEETKKFTSSLIGKNYLHYIHNLAHGKQKPRARLCAWGQAFLRPCLGLFLRASASISVWISFLRIDSRRITVMP